MFTNEEFLILKYCFDNIKNDFFASEIARKLTLNQKTVSNYLNLYLNENILNFKFEGRNKIFFFNLNNLDLIKNLFLQVEVEKTQIFLKKHYKIRELLKEMDLRSYLIFGSYAKNLEQKGSDLDIFLIGNYDEKKIKFLSKKYNIEININSLNKKRFKKVLFEKQILLKEIILNHLIVNDYEYFIDHFLENY